MSILSKRKSASDIRGELSHVYTFLDGDFESERAHMILKKFVIDQSTLLSSDEIYSRDQLQNESFEIVSYPDSLTETNEWELGADDHYNSIASGVNSSSGDKIDFGTLTSNSNDEDSYPDGDTSCPDMTIEKATQICSVAIPVNNCSAVIDRDLHLQTCVSDVYRSKSISFAKSASSTHQVSCSLHVEYVAQIPAFAQRASTLQVSLGYGINSCKDQCSGNGMCTSMGFMCANGYLGESCNIKISDIKNNDYLNNTLASSPDLLYKGIIDVFADSYKASTRPELSVEDQMVGGSE